MCTDGIIVASPGVKACSLALVRQVIGREKRMARLLKRQEEEAGTRREGQKTCALVFGKGDESWVFPPNSRDKENRRRCTLDLLCHMFPG